MIETTDIDTAKSRKSAGVTSGQAASPKSWIGGRFLAVEQLEACDPRAACHPKLMILHHLIRGLIQNTALEIFVEE